MTDTPVSKLATGLPEGQSAHDLLAEQIKKAENNALYKEANPAAMTGIHPSPGGRYDIGYGYDIKSPSFAQIKADLEKAAGASYWSNNPTAEKVLAAYKEGKTYTFEDGTRVPTATDLAAHGPQITKAQADTLLSNEIKKVEDALGSKITLADSWERLAVLDLGYNL